MARKSARTPAVLAVGGVDPTTGAGVGADVRTLETLGVMPAIAVTAIAVQDGVRVHRVTPLAPATVREQIEAALGAMPVRAVKCGMLATPAIVAATADALSGRGLPLVVDPVLFASGGEPLARGAMTRALRERLLPIARVVTPNLREADLLSGIDVHDEASMIEAARRLLALGAGAVVVKGGHLPGAPVDVLVTSTRVERFGGRRVPGGDMHGTGCAFASALAAGLARGSSLRESVMA